MRTHLEYWFAVVILELARVLDRVPSMQPVEQEYAVGKISVMASWQFLRTCKGVNSNRSMRTWRACTASACGAWTRMSVACVVPPPLASRLCAACDYMARPSARHPRACRRTAGRLPFTRARSCSTAWRSPTRAQRRVALLTRAGRPLRLRACGGPAPDRRRVQGYGGAVFMAAGAVTFRGSSTIARTQALRPARRTPSRARTCY